MHRRFPTLPVISVKPGQQYPNERGWMSPFVSEMSSRYKKLVTEIDEAYVMHTGKEELKLTEDPWENYLFFDSKYLLPIICNQTALAVEE